MNHSKRILEAWNDPAFTNAIDAILTERLKWLDDTETHGADMTDTIEAIDKALKPLLEASCPEQLRQARDDQMADDAWNTHREG